MYRRDINFIWLNFGERLNGFEWLLDFYDRIFLVSGNKKFFLIEVFKKDYREIIFIRSYE